MLEIDDQDHIITERAAASVPSSGCGYRRWPARCSPRSGRQAWSEIRDGVQRLP
jgi:hypothetical protein